MRLAVALAGLLLAGGFAGCVGGKDGGPVDTAPIVPQTREERRQLQIQEIKFLNETRTDARVQAAVSVLNYSFPWQAELPEARTYFNGTVAPQDGFGHEAPRDEGATSVNPILKTQDVAPFLPADQPVEVSVTLFWTNDLGSSADLDVFVDLPGVRTDYSLEDQYAKFGANFESRTFSVVGVEGYPSRIGVQVSNPVALLKPVAFTLRMVFTYVADVLGPGQAVAVEVPPDARALVFTTEKAHGEDHLNASVLLVGPGGEVRHLAYDDVNLPDQRAAVTVFPGTWTLYGEKAHGGFLRVGADQPLQRAKVTPLVTEFQSTVVAVQPEATSVTPMATMPWSPDGGRVPLALWVTTSTDRSATANATVILTNDQGRVLLHKLLARVDVDRDQRVGSTDEENRRPAFFNYWPARLTNGAYTLHYTSAGTASITLHAVYV